MIERLKGSRPFKVVGAYGESQAGNYANGLAFNAFMCMFPLILGILSVVGLVIQDEGVRQQVQDKLLGIFPGSAQPEIGRSLQQVHQSAGILGVISIVGLIWGGSNLFVAVEFALTRIFGTKQRDFLRQRAMSVVMMALFMVAVVATVAANALMNLIPFMAAAGPVIAAAVLVGILLVIYRFVPNRTFKLGEIWSGAVVAGIGIEIVTLLFPLYGKLMHGFNSYGAAFALFFLLATWLLFVSQLILLGAVWNRTGMRGFDASGLVPSPPEKAKDTPEPHEAIGRRTPSATSR